uniref:C-type lectin domain-containing protein n=1 Tax=Plectus sambesii TaxID=2011161 RepID=A0A914XIY7_9BILA
RNPGPDRVMLGPGYSVRSKARSTKKQVGPGSVRCTECQKCSVHRVIRCRCPEHATGANCETLLQCDSASCPANSDCIVQNQKIKCICKDGYIQNDNGECVPKMDCKYVNGTCDVCADPHPCQNDGICEPIAGSDDQYRCRCPENTTGTNCETLLQCSSTSCPANSDCFVQNHQMNCICKPDYIENRNGECVIMKMRQACVMGDPHYQTFDGLIYDYHGTCPHVVSQPCKEDDISPFFSIRAQNVQIGALSASAVNWAELRIHGHAFAVDQGLSLTVDGVTQPVPYFYPNETEWLVKAYISANWMYIMTKEGIQIAFALYFMCVSVSEEMMIGTGRLCGLFGDVDNNCKNDLRGKNQSLLGIPNDSCNWPFMSVIPSVIQFGDDWIDDYQSGMCLTGDVITSTLPCTTDQYIEAQKACQAIVLAKSGIGIFAKCSRLGAQLDAMYARCAFDTCVDENFRCNSLTQLVHICQQAFPGTVISGWRENVTCPLECSENQKYSDCVSGCRPTCTNMTAPLTCGKPCVEGCTCSDGMLLDGTGLNCVPQTECANVPDPCCPSGWSIAPNGTKCLYLSSERLSWFDAARFCQSTGGQLVSLHSDLEGEMLRRWILNSFPDPGVWLGGVTTNPAPGGNNWYWLDQTTFDYRSWAPGQPDNNEENCKAQALSDTSQSCLKTYDIRTSGQWDDECCSAKLLFICGKCPGRVDCTP